MDSSESGSMSRQKTGRNGATAVTARPKRKHSAVPAPNARTAATATGRCGTKKAVLSRMVPAEAPRGRKKGSTGDESARVTRGPARSKPPDRGGNLRQDGVPIRIVRADPIPAKFRDLAVVTIEEYAEIMRLGRSTAYKDVSSRPDLVLKLSSVPRIPVARLRRLLMGEV
jgi:hypothetical protein